MRNNEASASKQYQPEVATWTSHRLHPRRGPLRPVAGAGLPSPLELLEKGIQAPRALNQFCDACSVSVSPEEVVYKLARPDSAGFVFHATCFAIWRDERNNMTTGGPRLTTRERQDGRGPPGTRHRR